MDRRTADNAGRLDHTVPAQTRFLMEARRPFGEPSGEREFAVRCLLCGIAVYVLTAAFGLQAHNTGAIIGVVPGSIEYRVTNLR